MIADLNVHWDIGADGEPKPHAHVMLTMREVNEQGFGAKVRDWNRRSEEHTSELQSLMRISYAVFCLKKKKRRQKNKDHKEQKMRNKKSHRFNKQHTTMPAKSKS